MILQHVRADGLIQRHKNNNASPKNPIKVLHITSSEQSLLSTLASEYAQSHIILVCVIRNSQLISGIDGVREMNCSCPGSVLSTKATAVVFSI